MRSHGICADEVVYRDICPLTIKQREYCQNLRFQRASSSSSSYNQAMRIPPKPKLSEPVVAVVVTIKQ
jgi:hypothetical protein